MITPAISALLEREAVPNAWVGRARVVEPGEDFTTMHADYLNLDGVLPRTQYPHGKAPKKDQEFIVATQNTGGSVVFQLDSTLVYSHLLAGVVPEVREGLVVVVYCAREPFKRSKVAVAPTREDIDPLAVCVGRNHNRIDYLREQLGEQVDIVAFNTNPSLFIKNAMSPAHVSNVVLNEKKRKATCYVPAHQMSAAVGAQGLNAALSSKLTGYKIRVVSQ